MRFNKQELMTLASQPSNKFDKEGILFVREKQEGFFRRAEISTERWCRLRGNMLFYLKSREHWSEPAGVIVLEQCTVKLETATQDGPYGFLLAFEGGLSQHLACHTEGERDSWVQVLHMASYQYVQSQLIALEQQVRHRRGEKDDLDAQLKRYLHGHCLDPMELPLFEVAFSCDNLLCDGHGRPPNPMLMVHTSNSLDALWTKYSQTEVVERSSNPLFLTTVSFLSSDGISELSRIRFTVHDVRERVTNTSTQIGWATILLGSLRNTDRVRIPLYSLEGTTVGFLTIMSWNLECEDKGSTASTPCRSSPDQETLVLSHRRTQSLPPRLGSKLKLPPQGQLHLIFHNPFLRTYRFHSGLGGDICVHEIMAESKLCFMFPQQLLTLWIVEEKEQMQEVAGLGDLCDPWHSRQIAVLDRHLHLINIYAQAKENLDSHEGPYFKPSCKKDDSTYEFVPVNLHLQRMWAQNESLRKSSFYDIITVGAFTAYPHKYKTGGLIKLLHQLKSSSNKGNGSVGPEKIQMAHDAVQCIKRLRREIVEKMQMLLKLAKDKKSMGMITIIEELMAKTRLLLSICDPSLVEEAFSFLEKHRMTPDSTHVSNGEHDLASYRNLAEEISKEFKAFDESLLSPSTPEKGGAGDFAMTVPTETVSHPTTNGKGEDPEGEPEEATVSDFELAKRFLDTQAMSSSPSANYYRPTDEPEPWELTQLNIEASVMCLVSKVKVLCGCGGSPAPRLSRVKGSLSVSSRLSRASHEERRKSDPTEESLKQNGPRGESIGDWVSELRPSMKKLRQAMDGLLKTARLTHGVFRLQEPSDGAKLAQTIKYRRDVCFCQALTALVSGLMARLWCQKADPTFLFVLSRLGPLVSFEGLLSYYSTEAEMWGDMVVAIEDLRTVQFILVMADKDLSSEKDREKDEDSSSPPQILPRVQGSRNGLRVLIPVPDFVYSLLPIEAATKGLGFTVTPVFFNVGINEQATLAEKFGDVRPQEKSNVDNYERLNEYYHRFRRLPRPSAADRRPTASTHPSLAELMERLKQEVHSKTSKNVQVLHLAAQISRKMMGLRFTSCKSAKDRTSMSVTLEQCHILGEEYDLAEHEFQKALDCTRSQGCRRENAWKNIGLKKYAFNSLQLLALPKQYRPPPGTFGSGQT